MFQQRAHSLPRLPLLRAVDRCCWPRLRTSGMKSPRLVRQIIKIGLGYYFFFFNFLNEGTPLRAAERIAA